MNPRIALFISCVVSLATMAGCAAPTSDAEPSTDTSEAAYSSGTWQRLVTCNGGAAVLDVDTGERRQLQLDIRDANAVNYLTGQIGMQLGPLNRGNGRELIVGGWSNNGAFSRGDFHAFSAPMATVGAAYVYREGKGIRVKFEHDDGIQGGFCTDNLGGFEGGCLGGWAGGTRVSHELANWYFDSCN
jgi:hypothetical protein